MSTTKLQRTPKTASKPQLKGVEAHTYVQLVTVGTDTVTVRIYGALACFSLESGKCVSGEGKNWQLPRASIAALRLQQATKATETAKKAVGQ